MTGSWLDFRTTWRRAHFLQRLWFVVGPALVCLDVAQTQWSLALDLASLVFLYYITVWQGQKIDDQRAQLRAMR